MLLTAAIKDGALAYLYRVACVGLVEKLLACFDGLPAAHAARLQDANYHFTATFHRLEGKHQGKKYY